MNNYIIYFSKFQPLNKLEEFIIEEILDNGYYPILINLNLNEINSKYSNILRSEEIGKIINKKYKGEMIFYLNAPKIKHLDNIENWFSIIEKHNLFQNFNINIKDVPVIYLKDFLHTGDFFRNLELIENTSIEDIFIEHYKNEKIEIDIPKEIIKNQTNVDKNVIIDILDLKSKPLYKKMEI